MKITYWVSFYEITTVNLCLYGESAEFVGQVPHDVFTEWKKRLFLVVSEHLKHNRLCLDVVDEGFCYVNSNLEKNKAQRC